MTVYQYRVYLTKSQETSLKKTLNVHCNVYNQALTENQSQYELTKKGPSAFDQIKSILPNYDRQGVNYSSLQQTIRRFHKNKKGFFVRKRGFPKPIEKCRVIEFGKASDGWRIKDNRLHISGLGFLRVNWHRTMFGKPKSLILSVKDNGKIFVSFTTDHVQNYPANSGAAVGIDLGLKTFAVTSDGEKIEHPLPYKRKLKLIKTLRKQIRASKDNAIRLRKKKKALRNTHRKVTNQRKDFLHKISKKIVDSYGAIAVEDIKVQKFGKRYRNINRKQNDVAWASFLRFLEYKSKRQGVVFKRVDPAYTTQECSKCHKSVPKSLKDRVHVCDCGHVEDRDINAAKNILARGFGSGTTEPGNDVRHQSNVTPRSPRIHSWE